MGKTLEGYLDMGRLALSNPNRYARQYGITKGAFIERLRSKHRICFSGEVRMALFGNGVALYETGFLSSVQFLRLCDKIDELSRQIDPKDEEKSKDALEKLMELCKLSYDAVDFIDDTGVFDYNPYSQKREFCFDPERIRAIFKAESKNHLVRKAYGRSAQKVLRRAAKYADDRTLQESMRKIIEMLTQGLIKELGEKEIRCSRNDSEEFFRKNYHVPEPVLINLRDVCEDSRNVAYFYESSTARRARRLKQLTEMGAPSIIIYNEQRLKYENELYRLLAEYVGRQPETDDSVRRFVGDTYMTLLALPNQESCNLKQDEDAIKKYRDAAEKIMQRVRELIPLAPAQAK